MQIPEWIGELGSVLPPGALLTGGDAALYAVDGRVPRAALFPETIEQVQAVVALAGRRGLALCALGGGEHLGLGAPPSRLDAALSLRRLAGRVEHQPEEMVVTVEAGVRLAALQEILACRGQWLPVDPDPAGGRPAAESRATLGGLLAADVSGACRLGYGSLRDRLLGVRAVLADGSLVRSGGRVVKNVAGYDLCRLFTGSLGTLGVLVEATFLVCPLPPARRCLVAALPGLSPAADALDAVAASELLPAAAELANAAAWGGGPTGSWRLALEFHGPEETVARQMERARALLEPYGPPEEMEGDEARRRSAVAPGGFAARPVVCRLSCLSSKLPALLAEIPPALPAAAHALLGVARVALPADAGAAAAVGRLRAAAAGIGGALVVESAPASLKASAPPGSPAAGGAGPLEPAPASLKASAPPGSPAAGGAEPLDVWGPVRPDFGLMRAVKAQLDPRGILSPGRFVGGL